MKTLEEIRKETEDYMWTTFKSLMITAVACDNYRMINNLINQFAVNVAKESLKNASENAKIMVDGEEQDSETFFNSDCSGSSTCYVSQQSILNESNIPKL